jgi:hypothetical protein
MLLKYRNSINILISELDSSGLSHEINASNIKLGKNHICLYHKHRNEFRKPDTAYLLPCTPSLFVWTVTEGGQLK